MSLKHVKQMAGEFQQMLGENPLVLLAVLGVFLAVTIVMAILADTYLEKRRELQKIKAARKLQEHVQRHLNT